MKEHAIWRKAASAVLAASLGAAVCTPALGALPAAWAADYGTGTITISKAQGNGAVTYDGYRIFEANVANDAQRTATNIAWASDGTRAAVLAALESWGAANGKEYTGTSAQDAADYISANLSTATDGLALAIARGLVAAGSGASPDATSIEPGTTQQLGEGYWLFVTTPQAGGATSEDATGTAPVFYTVVGGSAVTVTEKTGVPRVEKQVMEDATSANGTAADSFIGQELAYTLTGTVAENIAAFDAYSYAFEDALSAGLDVVGTTAGEDGWSVKAYPGEPTPGAGIDIDPSCYDVSYEDHVLTVSFDDLKSLKKNGDVSAAIDVGADTRIVVTYRAKLTGQATPGEAQTNEVRLRYANDPVSGGTGTSASKTTSTYTYALNLVKLDKSTEAPLAGAKFTLRYTGDGKTNGQYVVASHDTDSYTVTGTTGNDFDSSENVKATELETNSRGRILIVGLNAGSYEIYETEAPKGYDTARTFSFTITPTYDASGKLTELANKVSASGFAIAGESDGNTEDGILQAKAEGANASDSSSGAVTVSVGDVKQIQLPLTGMSGVSWTLVAGGAVLLLTAAYAARATRKRREQE